VYAPGSDSIAPVGTRFIQTGRIFQGGQIAEIECCRNSAESDTWRKAKNGKVLASTSLLSKKILFRRNHDN
jgi:hypothetical protein